MDNFEAVDKLVSKFGISYADAKEALEGANWDMLDAVMALEKAGKIRVATAAYATSAAQAQPAQVGSVAGAASYVDEAEVMRRAAESEARKARRARLWERIKAVALDNHVAVRNKDGKTLVRLPLVAAVLVCVLFFWVLIFAILIAFLLGCQLVFEGPELGKESVNKAARVVGETVADLGQDLKEKIEENQAKKNSSDN